MRRFLHNNGLALVTATTFLIIWFGGQTTAGLRTYNAERRQDGQSEVSFAGYLTTAHFGEATFENWESEFLQMGMYVVLTVKLRQRGSAESKPLEGSAPQDEDPEEHRDDVGAPWPVRHGGVWLALYKKSLSLVLLMLFVGVVPAPRADRQPRVQQRAGRGRIQRPRQRLVVHVPVAVLVRVAPELAVRVPGDRGDHHPDDLSAAARITGVEAGPRASHANRLRLTSPRC